MKGKASMPTLQGQRWLRASLAAAALLATLAPALAEPAAKPEPASASLRLDRQGLLLLGADGRELDRLPLRAKRWDQRPDRQGRPLAVLLDADRGLPLLVRSEGQVLRTQTLPEPGFQVEALCLHRDPQGLLHLFLLDEEGLSAQWLLGESAGQPAARPLRRLATAPSPQGCRVDDERQLLQIGETGVGQWLHGTEAEGKPQRRLQAAGRTGRASSGGTAARPRRSWPLLQASAQTEPVARLGDAADDPAIWVHPADGSRSRILGTNKKQGLLVYELQGRQLQLLEVGRINNVDLRQGLGPYGGVRLDLAVATQRDENALLLFGIDGEGRVSELARLPTTLQDIYGLCVARSPEGLLEAFPNDKDGRVQRLRIEQVDGRWQARLLAELRLASQPEGCVVDEGSRRLFVGEEKRGIWALDLGADGLGQPQPVLRTGGALQADVEGLALYRGRAGAASYLLVSSQGDDSYLVLDAQPPYALRGGFRIGINPELGIDGSSETDGLELSSADFGGIYGQGLLVVQDGHKRLPDGPQNFKLLPWSEVARALRLP